jgi:hypothetical protein
MSNLQKLILKFYKTCEKYNVIPYYTQTLNYIYDNYTNDTAKAIKFAEAITDVRNGLIRPLPTPTVQAEFEYSPTYYLQDQPQPPMSTVDICDNYEQPDDTTIYGSLRRYIASPNGNHEIELHPLQQLSLQDTPPQWMGSPRPNVDFISLPRADEDRRMSVIQLPRSICYTGDDDDDE